MLQDGGMNNGRLELLVCFGRGRPLFGGWLRSLVRELGFVVTAGTPRLYDCQALTYTLS
jgi:hypothetical protein